MYRPTASLASRGSRVDPSDSGRHLYRWPPMRSDALLELTAAIADGVLIDWDAAESRAADEEERRLIRKLRLVAQTIEAMRERQQS